MRFRYVLSEVLVGLWRNVTMTVAMIITMAVSLTMLGASFVLYRQVDQMKTWYYDRIEVSIFLSKDITDAQRQNIDASLTGDELVRSVEYENKEQAYTKFRELYADAPDLLSAVKPDQLPESFRVKLKDPQQYQLVFDKYKNTEGIDDIVDQRKLLNKIFDILGAIQTMALVAASIMAVAALMLVGNTIQVAAYSKRREVAVMKLVGASNWFIQSPFVLEAVVAGVVGAVLAFVGLVLSKWLLIDGSLQTLNQLLTPVHWSTIFATLPLMAAAGALISAVTAWVTLRFYIRV
ncbi:permease-like cell division protein FtsX [Rhizomonospora bruguierae]|uniref:permease-like cell division protein FtsX n=1 Tax=Rhizomonospora bruguierae TaxID=1581705 RepID=UPI001BD0611B|nr:permease-like cell division protein FtsX [Micromonospora sp. NBRC 107566]